MVGLKGFIIALGIEPKDLGWYRRALTHLSCASSPGESYERLEYLGDAVIGVVVSDFLFRIFPEKEEGELSRVRAKVVSRESLGKIAQELGIEKHLRVETTRVKQGSRTEFSILGDAFESIVGAIFADRGYVQARKFIMACLKQVCLTAGETEGPIDYKSRLQEMWQQKYKEPPVYKVVSETGPDHNKVFLIAVKYKGKILGKGEGSSKKRAEQEAANAALEKILAQEC